MKRKRTQIMLNGVFLVICGAILIFLLRAPEETTAMLPKDENHSRFYTIASRKEAEKFCGDCHAENKTAPLAEDHPPKYRCLFCHKRIE